MPRVAIFSEPGGKKKDKSGKLMIHAILTKVGRAAFEKARDALRALYLREMGHDPALVSDADTIEFMARGVRASETYLKAKRRELDRA